MDKDDLEQIEWARERRSLGHLLWRLKQWLSGLPCKGLGHRWPPKEIIRNTIGLGPDNDFSSFDTWQASLPSPTVRKCRRCGLEDEGRICIGIMYPSQKNPNE